MWHKNAKKKHFNTFFNDVREYFPNNKLEVKNKQLFIDDKLFGWGIPLSTFQRMKSSSFPDVASILYDEFIKEKDSSHFQNYAKYNLMVDIGEEYQPFFHAKDTIRTCVEEHPQLISYEII